MGSRTLQQCRSGVEQTPPQCRPRPALQLPKLPYQQRARIETEAARPMRPMQCAGKAGWGSRLPRKTSMQSSFIPSQRLWCGTHWHPMKTVERKIIKPQSRNYNINNVSRQGCQPSQAPTKVQPPGDNIKNLANNCDSREFKTRNPKLELEF